MVEVSTTSPGPTPRPTRPTCSAAVPELRATAWGTPMRAHISDSNAARSGPAGATQPDAIASATYLASSSPTSGAERGIRCISGDRGLERRRTAGECVAGPGVVSDALRWQRWNAHVGDQRVQRANSRLVLAEELLVQLLPLAQAGEHDLDVLAGHRDHPLGHVDDLHRLPHVQHQR